MPVNKFYVDKCTICNKYADAEMGITMHGQITGKFFCSIECLEKELLSNPIRISTLMTMQIGSKSDEMTRDVRKRIINALNNVDG